MATSILAFEEGGAIVRYPGNYDTYRSLKAEAEAMRSEKGDRSVKAKAAAAPVPAKTPEKAEKKSRLTYSERLELEGIMARITAAEEKATAIATELHDPALYASRPEAARDLQARLTAAEAEVQALTQRWEDLEARASG